VVDLTKKRNRIRSNYQIDKQQLQPDSTNLPDLVALASQLLQSESGSNKSVLGDIKEVSTVLVDTKDITEESNTSEHESVFLSKTHGDTSVDSSVDDSDSNIKMVKSHSANNSPIFEDESIVQVV